MIEPVWLDPVALILLHDESLVEHGGAAGLRDSGLLESAMARPRNLLLYESVTALARLAAAYAFGIVKNHPFADGNKRAGFAAALLFLAANGVDIDAEAEEATAAVLLLAAGETTEEDFAAWLKARTRVT